MDPYRLLKPALEPFSALYVLIFVFHCPGANSLCRTGTRSECEESDFVPGHNLVGEGIDLVTLERKGAYLIDTDNWRQKDHTCTLCPNALLEDTPLQKLPRSIVDWRIHNSCSRKVSSSILHSSFQVMEFSASSVVNDWKVGLDVNVKPSVNIQVTMAGSHSRMAEFSMQKSRQDQYSFMSHEISCTYYRYRAINKPYLTSHFYYILKNLPKLYNEMTKPNYLHVIDTYGTHYITQLFLGGKVRDVTAIKSCESSLDEITVDEVKDCLSLEASITVVTKGKITGGYSTCEDLKKKKNFKGSFHEKYSERQSEVDGGEATADLLFAKEQDPEKFGEWMESLKTIPGIVSFSLKPIHTLVRFQGPQKENLRKAISEYIIQKAVHNNCSSSCPPRAQKSKRDSCSCFCSVATGINSMCCSTGRGFAKLTVNIQRATGLWGDYFSKTDAFVKVIFQNKEMRTNTVWNNDNPTWTVHFDFGTVQLNQGSSMKLEVWDEDNRYDDDLLGACNEKLSAGFHKPLCYLNHGSLAFFFNVVCGPHLGGPQCMEYIPSPE
ncbi:perforin-1 [Microcaecilia unicolor]|uniref:Perforin-1-like n=1 Tax=Microcaecilia unicolor TaxID=1415580 RepID=A0A6P7YAY2_9AMPH|nr:perforin-1-like [Microcaecilia unicolor]XP_030064652.1 perforin-1-like [Microcaecilia unicolor]